VPVGGVALNAILDFESQRSIRRNDHGIVAHEAAIRACVPLLAAFVALAVEIAGTLGAGEIDLVVLGPSVADTPSSTADRGSLSVLDAHS